MTLLSVVLDTFNLQLIITFSFPPNITSVNPAGVQIVSQVSGASYAFSDASWALVNERMLVYHYTTAAEEFIEAQFSPFSPLVVYFETEVAFVMTSSYSNCYGDVTPTLYCEV